MKYKSFSTQPKCFKTRSKSELGRGAGEMDQWLGVLAALPGGLGLIASAHKAAYNCL